MGLFDKLFHREPKGSKTAAALSGYLPIYSQYGTDVYASDVVQQALRCIVTEIKKLEPTHVRYSGNDPVPVKSREQEVLDLPNPLMTSSDFIEKVTWLLLLNYNAFIIPTYWSWKDPKTGEERRYFEALYPIKPIQVDFIEDASERLYVKFYFRNGDTTAIPYENVIHLRYSYSVNDYMGGNEQGQPDNEALLKTLQLNHQLLQGLAKAMNASYQVNGVVKYNTFLDKDKMDAALADFESKLKNNESGILPIDIKAEYIPLEKKTALVDEATLKFIDDKILRFYGVPIEIVRGNYTQEIYNSFYQKALEPIIKSMCQAFTKTIFTARARAFGNRIEFYPEELIFMTTAQKLEMVNTLSPTGALFENEKRVAFGLRPAPELEGKRYMSLNWINADNADEYQTGRVSADAEEKGKGENNG